MDEKLSEFRRWLDDQRLMYEESEWDSFNAGSYEALDIVIDEFDERFGA